MALHYEEYLGWTLNSNIKNWYTVSIFVWENFLLGNIKMIGLLLKSKFSAFCKNIHARPISLNILWVESCILVGPLLLLQIIPSKDDTNLSWYLPCTKCFELISLKDSSLYAFTSSMCLIYDSVVKTIRVSQALSV